MSLSHHICRFSLFEQKHWSCVFSLISHYLLDCINPAYHTGCLMEPRVFSFSSATQHLCLRGDRGSHHLFVYTGQILGELSPALSVSNELQLYDWQTGYRPAVNCWATCRAAVCERDWLDTCLMKRCVAWKWRWCCKQILLYQSGVNSGRDSHAYYSTVQ